MKRHTKPVIATHLIDTISGKVIEFSDPRINDIIRSACEENSFVVHHYAHFMCSAYRKEADEWPVAPFFFVTSDLFCLIREFLVQ